MDTSGDVGVGYGETPEPRSDIAKPRQPQKKGAAKKMAEEPAKRGAKALAKAAGAAIKKAALAAVSSVAGAVGWPVLVGCIVIFLIILLVFGSLAAYYIRGGAGKTMPQRAGKNDPNIAKVLTLTKQETGEKGSGNMKLNFLNARDLEYLQSGQIDKRLLAALVYLADHHEHIRVSHIVSGYEDMKTNVESGSFHNKQISNNISAHRDGLAADIDEIDYVPEKCDCGNKIPVKVQWQAMGENPFGTAPDALSKIKSPQDLISNDVKAALEKLGVKGLDDPAVQEKLTNATGVLATIKSPFDLTRTDVINALKSIGVTGIDNTDLQTGLKRLEAIQQIGQLDLSDLSALQNPNTRALFAQIGITLDDATIASLEKFQSTKILLNLKSLDDLNRSDVQLALQNLGINPNDPNFKAALQNIQMANLLMGWNGDPNNTQFQQALKSFGINYSDDLGKALGILQAAGTIFSSPAGTLVSNVDIVAALESMGIQVDNPDLQKVIDQYRSAYNIVNWAGPIVSTDFANYLQGLGIGWDDNLTKYWEQYQAAQTLINFDGSLDSPEVQRALGVLGVDASAIGEIKNKGAAEWLLEKGGLPENFQTIMGDFKSWEALLSAKNLDAFKSASVQEALRQLNLDQYQDLLANLGSLSVLLNVKNLQDLTNPMVKQALAQLHLPTDIQKYLGQLSNLQALANIHSPLDLLRPDVQSALKNLGVSSDIINNLGKAGSVYALTQIKSPADLLKPGTLAALNDLGIINVNSQLLGQIGALQTLLQVDSFQDLFNPSTILALNQLGLIALSGPVAVALMAVSFLDNIFGLGLFGDDCKASTACYKPTAQDNVYKVIENLLQMPYDLGDKEKYRVTQLIVYSLEYTRSKDSSLDSKLDKLYWPNRPANVGLFTMPEAWQNIHIGY